MSFLLCLAYPTVLGDFRAAAAVCGQEADYVG